MNYEIEITRRCNYSCPGCNHLCNIAPDPSSDMTYKDIGSVVNQINALDPAPGLVIVIGGEPTLHPECAGFCRYIKDNLKRGGELLLDTNFSRPDVIAACEAVGFTVRDYKGSRDPDEVFRRKASYHFNVLLSPKDEHLPAVSPKQCNVLNGLGGSWTCGMSIHRYRGALRWCWCPGGSSICKLLRREEFLFPTLSDLFNSDVDLFRSTICPHCMYLARPQILAKDSMGRVSECFKQGLAELRAYVAEAVKANSGHSAGRQVPENGCGGVGGVAPSGSCGGVVVDACRRMVAVLDAASATSLSDEARSCLAELRHAAVRCEGAFSAADGGSGRSEGQTWPM